MVRVPANYLPYNDARINELELSLLAMAKSAGGAHRPGPAKAPKRQRMMAAKQIVARRVARKSTAKPAGKR